MENKSNDNKGLKIIKYSYIAAVVFGLVAFILLFLDLNTYSNSNYNAFVMSFDENIGGLRYLYLIATFFTAILFLWSIYSLVKIMLTKDIKSGVKVNYKKKIDKSPLYAKIYLVFQLAIALFSFIVFVISDEIVSDLNSIKINMPVAVSIAIFSLLSISSAGIGDYFYDMEEYKIALELIAEKEKEESKEEVKEENKKESESKRLDLNEKEEKKEVKEDKKEEKVEENNDVKKEESEEENKIEEKVEKEKTDENKTPSKSTNHKNENSKSSSSQKSSSSTKKATSSAKKTTSSNTKSSTKLNSKKK